MAKVSIRKDEYERVLEIAERAARRTNSRVVVAMDRVDVQEAPEVDRLATYAQPAAAKFS
jgi:hypothetical protein